MFGNNSQSQGFGTTANQGNTGLFGGVGGSLFQNTQPTQSTFGSTNNQAFGQGFGGGTSAFGAATQPQAFQENNQNTFAQPNQGGLFGQSSFAQPPISNQPSVNFGSTGNQGGGFSGFGAQPTASSGIFGGQTQGVGLFGNNQPQSNALFGQNSQSQSQGIFGNQSGFNKSQGVVQQPLFGQNPASSLFTGQSGFNQNQVQPTALFGNSQFNQQQPQQEQQLQLRIKFFQVPINQQIFTINSPFEFKVIQHEEKNQKLNLRFRNIRTEPQFSNTSTQMLRFTDMMARQKGQPIDCPEWKAQQSWPQNQSRYPLNRILNQVVQQGQNPQLNPNQQANPFGQQPQQVPSFGQNNLTGQQSTQIFGQNQPSGIFQDPQNALSAQKPQSFGLFAGIQPQATQNSFQNQSSGFGAINQPQNNLFGQTQGLQTNQTGGLFAQNNNNSLFNSAPSGTGTPGFGNQNNQNQGSLFQNNTSNKAGTLFGANAGLFQNQATGLFNNQQPQQAPNSLGGNLLQQQNQPTSLFNNQLGAGTSLFGQNNNLKQENTQAGSLFQNKQDQNAQQIPTNNLFANFAGGNNAQQQNPIGIQPQQSSFLNKPAAAVIQPGGLFSNTSAQQNQQNQGGVGLFQSNPGANLFDNTSAKPSLFGPQNTQQQPATNLFQNQQNQAQPSLFAPQNPNPQSSLQPQLSFGLQQTNQNTFSNNSGSLFGLQQPQAQVQQNQVQNQFNNQKDLMTQQLQSFYQQAQNDYLGIQGSFMDTPLSSAQDELLKIQEESELFKKKRDEKLCLTTQINNNGGLITSLSIGGNLLAQHKINPQQHSIYNFDDQDEIRYREKQELKERSYYYPNQLNYQKFNNHRDSYQFKQKNSNARQKEVFKNDQRGFEGKKNQILQKQDSITSTQSFRKKYYQDLQKNSIIEKKDQDIITLTIKTTDLEDKPLEHILYVHKSRDFQEVLNKIKTWLQNELRRQTGKDNIEVYDMELLKDNTSIPKYFTIEEAGIISNCELQLHYLSNSKLKKRNKPHEQANSDEFYESNKCKQFLQNQLQRSNQALFEEEEDNSYLPLPPKEDYIVNPSIDKLINMTKQELSSLQSFSIKNQYGSIQFLPFKGSQGIDLTNVDLYNDIQINERDVSVYANCDPENGILNNDKKIKPQVGKKLNVPSIITLYKISPTGQRTPKEQEKFLRTHLEKQGKFNANQNDNEKPEFLSYDHQTFEWQFKVPHFTKWGLDDDEDMEQDSQIQKPSQQIVEQASEQSEEEKEIQKEPQVNFSSQIRKYPYGSTRKNLTIKYRLEDRLLSFMIFKKIQNAATKSPANKSISKYKNPKINKLKGKNLVGGQLLIKILDHLFKY